MLCWYRCSAFSPGMAGLPTVIMPFCCLCTPSVFLLSGFLLCAVSTSSSAFMQRTLPIFTREGAAALVDRGCVSADRSVYRNCSYMTNLVVGSAGCREYISQGGIGAYATAAQYFEYGWGIITVHNHSHLHWRWSQVANKTDGSPLPAGTAPLTDEMWLVQTSTKPLVIASPLPPTPFPAPPSLSATAGSTTPRPAASASMSTSASASASATASASALTSTPSSAATASASSARASSLASTASPSPRVSSGGSIASMSATASPAPSWVSSSVLLLLNTTLDTASQQSQQQPLLAPLSLPLLMQDGRRMCSLLAAAARLLQWPVEQATLKAVRMLSPRSRSGSSFAPFAFGNASACSLAISTPGVATGATAFIMPSATAAAAAAASALPRTGRLLQQQQQQQSSSGSAYASAAVLDVEAYAAVAARLPALQAAVGTSGSLSGANSATAVEMLLFAPAAQADTAAAALQARLRALASAAGGASQQSGAAADTAAFAADFAVVAAAGNAPPSSSGSGSGSTSAALLAGSAASAFEPVAAASGGPSSPPSSSGSVPGIGAGAAAGAAIAALACAVCVAALLFVWFRRQRGGASGRSHRGSSKLSAKAKSKLLRTLSARSFGREKASGSSAGAQSASSDSGFSKTFGVASWGIDSEDASPAYPYPYPMQGVSAPAAPTEAQLSSHARRASAVARARSSSTVVHFNPLPLAHGSGSSV